MKKVILTALTFIGLSMGTASAQSCCKVEPETCKPEICCPTTPDCCEENAAYEAQANTINETNKTSNKDGVVARKEETIKVEPKKNNDEN